MHQGMNSETNNSTTATRSVVIVLASTGLLLLLPLLLIQSAMHTGLVYSQQQQYNTTTQVEIINGSSNPDNGQFYVPSEIQISSGSTVKWTNNDIAIHTVTQGSPSEADAGSELHFDSSLMPVGSTFEHTFNDTGLVDYYCTIHPWMTGKVMIRS
jgi:plastocyanin